MEFHQKRRQQFLSEVAYIETRKFWEQEMGPAYLQALTASGADANDRRRVSSAYADESFTTYMLRYTGGDALVVLREDFEDVISAHEQAAKYLQAYEKDPTFPPLRLVEIDEYERVLQLIGLCYLLRREDLLPRVAKMFDRSFSGKDRLYEELLSFGLTDRDDVHSWYHDAPYRDLINCLYRDSDKDSVADLEVYLKNWYTALSKAPWHDSHLRMKFDDCRSYFGYWAVEAGAVAYLLELNDSSFRDHIAYPKDLVDFARKNCIEFTD
jgi:hypothetical protein